MKRIAACAVAILIATVPSQVLAQACIGIPTIDGQFSLAGNFDTGNDTNQYGLTGSLDLIGPVSIVANGGMFKPDDSDESGTTFGGTLAYELRPRTVSLCPLAGVDYSTIDAEEEGVEASASALVFRAGLGIGKLLQAGNMNVTLFGIPHFMHIRTDFEVEGESLFDDSDNEFGATAGVRLSNRSVFGGAHVMFTTVEESDPTFGLTFGIMIGGAR